MFVPYIVGTESLKKKKQMVLSNNILWNKGNNENQQPAERKFSGLEIYFDYGDMSFRII